MSRGGWRGGRGGGGAGRGRGDAFLPWEVDSDIKPDYTPSELFPTYKPLPIPAPSKKREHAQIECYRAFRAAVRDGPLYAVISEQHADKNKPGSFTSGIDPFEGVQTYSRRYKKASRVAPKLSGRPFVKEFFPAELHDTIDPAKDRTKKKLSLAKPGLRSNVPGGADTLDADVAALGVTDDKEDEEKEDELPGEVEEEEIDSDFEEDEEEMGEDYNAEGYFDAGDDDFQEDDGGDENYY